MSGLSDNTIQFAINGKIHSVEAGIPPSTRLVDYIRSQSKLKGTKAMCYEGGCGICTLVATTRDMQTNVEITFAFRSCQTLLYSCAGWKIETIESLGDRMSGYHSVQRALSGFYGTQCGFCTPGFIMNLRGEASRLESLTSQQLEMLFDGNLCRCTGYRPILDAFKSLQPDASPQLKQQLLDIEDAYQSKCPKNGNKCIGQCSLMNKISCSGLEPKKDLSFIVGDVKWLRPTSLSSLYAILKNADITKTLKLTVGNTSEGVFMDDGPYSTYIDITGILELGAVNDVPLQIGANTSLNQCIDIFYKASKEHSGYEHLAIIAKHWEFVANNGIRNTGSWAGNLMMKHKHNEFPSDIFLTLSLLDVVLQIGNSRDSSVADLPLDSFLSNDMNRKVIISMTIPLQQNIFVRTYKITRRAVNSHAYVNAAFKFEVDETDGFRVTKQPYILFGGIRSDFVHAANTEKFLVGKTIGTNAVLKEALNQLQTELKPDFQPLDGTPEFRTNLAQSLFYKVILDMVGNFANPAYQSGSSILVRPSSSSQQSFDLNNDTWPIGQAMPKLESLLQCSGEAQYVNDIPNLPGELHGAFVQTVIGKAVISSVDATLALKVPGVVHFITKKDIPGRNSFISSAKFFKGQLPFPVHLQQATDPLFVDNFVNYAGQAIGIIVATTRNLALKAAKMVKITYSNREKPTLNIKNALISPESKISPQAQFNVNNDEKSEDEFIRDSKATGSQSQLVCLRGELSTDTQYHMPMESFVCLAIPIEDGLDIHLATQDLTEAQQSISEVLAIQANSINITTRRLGGSFGSKIYGTNVVSCAAAVAASKLQVPIRISLPLETNMTITGTREQYMIQYKVSFEKNGKISSIEAELIANQGHTTNLSTVSIAASKFSSIYYADKWHISSKNVNTDRAGAALTRAPGSVNATAAIENIMEHIADHLNQDPLDIRERNFVTTTHKNKNGLGPQGPNLAATSIVPLLKEKSKYKLRRSQIEAFNKVNRWKKRGISLMATYYPLNYLPFRYSSQVVIYECDGTVAICHGGTEMGQGINTKVAQVAAKVLGITLDYIKIKPTNTFVGANSDETGGSFGTDLVSHATIKCCEKLKARMLVVSNDMEKQNRNPPTWFQLVKECFRRDVDMSERYWSSVNEHPGGYDIFGGICIEVELDVLTGQTMILRADVIEDCGRSINPYLDIGQVEGSVMMGIGLFTTEEIKLDEITGRVLTTGTWDYKIPTALDIPVEFNVTLLPNGENSFGVARSKATGEPAVCLGYGVVCALRHAIKSARADAGMPGWFPMDTPVTVERIQQLCLNSSKDYLLHNSEI